MNIGLYISELLYEHNFVVLPGIGEFSTKYIPARFIPEERKIESPTKISQFNPDSISQASLLASFIAQKEQKSFFEATQHIAQFVDKMRNDLAEGRQVVLDRLGVFFHDPEGNMVFEPDQTVNYLAESAGLGVINEPAKPTTVLEELSPQIVETHQEKSMAPQVEEVPIPELHHAIDSPTEEIPVFDTPKEVLTNTSQPSQATFAPSVQSAGKLPTAIKWIAWLLVPVIIIIIFLAFNWRFIFGDNRQPAPRTADTHIAQPAQAEIVPEAEDPLAAEPATAVEPTPVAAQAATYDPAKQYFYIVVGSFQSLDVANQMVLDLNRRNPGMARIFMQTSDGFHRVSFGFYSTESEANAKLSYVRENINREAWILYR